MPPFRYIFTLFMAFVLMLAAGCGRDQADPRLLRAEAISADHPEEALACLDSIKPDELSAPDRHLFDFLTVKASDKAFIRHTSDSLILSVISYAETHRLAPAHRAETLYYGGRVYSDLGDYPTALSYFQQALDQLPDEPSTLPLRGVILSQTGQLMRKIGLYAESIPYTEKALELRRQSSDTKGEYYSLRALGYSYYMLKKYQEAEQYYNKAYLLSDKLPLEYRAEGKADLAEIKFRLGQTDSALFLIRNLRDSVKPSQRNNVLATAGNTYLAAGLLDTAYMYAKELIASERLLSKSSGYSLILHPDMLKFSTLDSLSSYISQFREMNLKEIETMETDRMVNQLNHYDYQKHLKDKSDAEAKVLKAESKNKILLLALICSIIINVVTLVTFFVKKKGLKVSTRQDREEASGKQARRKEEQISKTLSKSEKNPEDRTYCDYSETPIMDKLRQKVADESVIVRESEIWSELKTTILSSSPEFLDRLQLVTDGKLSEPEKELALLIRVGIKNAKFPKLLGITRSGVESRKASLCRKIFGKSHPTVDLIGFIMCL